MTTSDVRMKFQNGSIYNATDEELKEAMASLAITDIPNERLRHTAEIQSQAILHIQTQRLYAILEKERKMTEKWFMILAIGSLVIGGLSLLVQVLSELTQIGAVCQ